MLVAGGDNYSAELYDLATGALTIDDSINDERELHTTTVLKNGNVLVNGGIIGFGSAEIYTPSSRETSTTIHKMGNTQNNRSVLVLK